MGDNTSKNGIVYINGQPCFGVAEMKISFLDMLKTKINRLFFGNDYYAHTYLNRKQLNEIGKLYGVKRHFLECNWSYKQRIIKKVTGQGSLSL